MFAAVCLTSHQWKSKEIQRLDISNILLKRKGRITIRSDEVTNSSVPSLILLTKFLLT